VEKKTLYWETRFGFCAAASLAVLEVERFLLLLFEMLVNSQPIRLSGALLPITSSFIDFGVGFPVAVATLYTIRKYTNT
jgi:hypothetical protein